VLPLAKSEGTPLEAISFVYLELTEIFGYFPKLLTEPGTLFEHEKGRYPWEKDASMWKN
jgi:hypothetical protein